MMNKLNSDALCVFFAAVLFSIGGLFVKVVPWSALAINGGRSILSAVVIGLFMLKTRHKFKINPTVLVGALCAASTSLLYVFANKLTTAANTILLQFTAPIFIILFMWIFRKERPQKLDVVTCALVFAGIACFFLDGIQVGGQLGNALALLSGVSYAGVFMLNSFKGSDGLSSIFIAHGINGLIGLPFVFYETQFSAAIVSSVVVLGVFQMGLAYVFFTKGLETTPPVTAALISGIEPILNPVLVAIFYNELVSGMSIAGGIVVVVAIVTYNIIKGRSENTSAKLTR